MIISLVLLVIGAIFFASQFVPQKFCRKSGPAAYNISMVIGIFFTTTILFFIAKTLTEKFSCYSIYSILICLFAGIAWGLGNRFLVVGVNNLGIARAFTLLNLTVFFSFAGGVLFLHEIVSSQRLALGATGMGIIIAGCVLIIPSTNRAKKGATGSLAIVLAAILFGMFNVLVVYSLSLLPVFQILPLLGAGAMLPAIATGVRKGWFLMPAAEHLLAMSSGLFWAAGITFSLFGLGHFGAALGIPILNGSITLFSALWGIVIFRELHRTNLPRFLLGATLTIVGIIFISRI